MSNLLSREEVLKTHLGAVREMATKVGDVYKVKILGAEVPKSLINAFVSKAKKERDLDPRENWSDSDLAELFVKYVLDTYLNIDSIPVESIMGEKIEKDSQAQTGAQPVTEPGAQAQIVTEPAIAPITPPVTAEQPELVNAEETKVASIPASLQIEKVLFTLANLDAEDVKVQEMIMRVIPVERGTYKHVADGYDENVRGNKNLFKDKKESLNSVYKLLIENNYMESNGMTADEIVKLFKDTDSNINVSTFTKFLNIYWEEITGTNASEKDEDQHFSEEVTNAAEQLGIDYDTLSQAWIKEREGDIQETKVA